jgi:integrase
MHPDGAGKLWRKIADECGFEYSSPHGWKHSYATNGAMNLQGWYKGNSYLLQKCCMHEDFRTTSKYINDTSDSFLGAFQEKETKR